MEMNLTRAEKSNRKEVYKKRKKKKEQKEDYTKHETTAKLGTW